MPISDRRRHERKSMKMPIILLLLVIFAIFGIAQMNVKQSVEKKEQTFNTQLRLVNSSIQDKNVNMELLINERPHYAGKVKSQYPWSDTLLLAPGKYSIEVRLTDHGISRVAEMEILDSTKNKSVTAFYRFMDEEYAGLANDKRRSDLMKKRWNSFHKDPNFSPAQALEGFRKDSIALEKSLIGKGLVAEPRTVSIDVY